MPATIPSHNVEVYQLPWISGPCWGIESSQHQEHRPRSPRPWLQHVSRPISPMVNCLPPRLHM
eukprot:449513-Pyramimonas_sp.AAC.1